MLILYALIKLLHYINWVFGESSDHKSKTKNDIYRAEVETSGHEILLISVGGRV